MRLVLLDFGFLHQSATDISVSCGRLRSSGTDPFTGPVSHWSERSAYLSNATRLLLRYYTPHRFLPPRESQDVGMMGGDVVTGGGAETYLLLNGLDPATDLVEDYFYAWAVRADADDGTQYTLTARSKGVQIWEKTGEFAPGIYETEMYTAAMYEYYESDCYVEDYGEISVHEALARQAQAYLVSLSRR